MMDFLFLSFSSVVVVKMKVWGFIFIYAFATLSYIKERMIQLAGKHSLKSNES